MALVVADRVQETTTTTGTGTYTLAGAKDGFQSFAAVGDSNTTYYACTDGTDYEVGIGTYTASGTTLARTTIIESSNSDAAVNWGAGDKDIFVTLPASKATVLDASGNATFTGDVTFDGTSYNAFWDKSEDHLHFNDKATLSFGGTSASPNMWIEHNNTLNLNRIRGSNITIQDADGSNIAVFQEDAGAALYYNGSTKAEIVDTGLNVTGSIAVSGTVDGVDIATRDGVLTSTTTTANAAMPKAGGTFTGDVTFEGSTVDITFEESQNAIRFDDLARLYFGASSDLTIYHNSVDNHSYIVESGTGNLYVQGNNLFLRNAAGTENYISAISNGAVTLFHDNASKLATTSTGIAITGDATFADNGKAYFGTGLDAQIWHNGTNTYIQNYTNDLIIENHGNDKDVKILSDDGSGGVTEYFVADGSTGEAQLYHYGSEKLATKTGGIEVTGTVTASTIATDSGDFTADIAGDIILDAGGGQLIFKDDNTQIGQISNVDSGNLTFQSDVSNKDMVFKGNDNGTIVTALTLDMSDRGTAFFNHDIVLADYGIARFGDGNDLQIFHNSSHTFMDNATGNVSIRNLANDQDVIIQSDDGAGGLATYFLADGSTGEAVLHHYGSQKLATQTGGVSVTGDMLASGKIGLDSTDYITFTDNTQMDVYINGSNEFRFEADGDFHADGNVIAYSTTIASDASLKENIQPVLGLQSVMALDGVSFDWKRDGKKSAGVIAQQVQKIMPEAVTEVKAMNGSKHLSVNYNALTSVLIEAIKDLKAEIEELKNGSHN